MKPNRVGWVLVAFFEIAGFCLWRWLPQVYVGQIWMGVGALLAVLYGVLTLLANRAAKLANTGVRGRADILEMTQTGAYVNSQPRVKMRLRIEAPGILPFETTDTVTVPLIALGALQPGRPLTVALDPADPEKFVIDWSGSWPGNWPQNWTGNWTGTTGGPPITFEMEDGRTANLAGDPGTTAAVMQILAKYGIQPGNMDLRGNPQVRNEVLGVIQRAGYFGAYPGSGMQPAAGPPEMQRASGSPGMPVSAGPATAAPSAPAASLPGGEDPDPAVRLMKLAQLRDAGTITAAEFELHKQRILSDI